MADNEKLSISIAEENNKPGTQLEHEESVSNNNEEGRAIDTNEES